MKRISLAFIILLLFGACQSERKDYTEDVQVAADSAAVADTVAPRIIRTADIGFRVKQVQQTKERLSAAIRRSGGTISAYTVTRDVEETEKVRYRADSLEEIIAYRTRAELTAKVPAEQLDSFMDSVAALAVSVDRQSMSMDDQSLTYMANRLKARNRAEALAAIARAGKKTGNDARTAMDVKDGYVDKQIDNRLIDEQVRWSTVTLSFYQDRSIQTLVVPNDRISDYGPSFWEQLGLNLLLGWSFLQRFVLLLMALWPFIGLAVILFVVIRYFRRRNRTALAPAFAVEGQGAVPPAEKGRPGL